MCFTDSVGEKYQSLDYTERRSRICYRYGGQFNDARAGLSSGHKAFRSLRKCLCNRRRGILFRFCYRYVEQSSFENAIRVILIFNIIITKVCEKCAQRTFDYKILIQMCYLRILKKFF